MLVEQLFSTGLGHASYLVADPDSGVAFLVDPERDPTPYLAAAARLGVLVTHSFETHVHNDYLSGSHALAQIRPITVVTGAAAKVEYPHTSLADGEAVEVGALVVRALATPGHTPEHVAFLVADLTRAQEPQYLFSGGALLVGHIARVDLLGRELEEQLARDAYATLRERILKLEDHLAVFPTHGGGSACSAGASSSRWTTLGFERRYNPIAVAAGYGYERFREEIGHGLPVAPAYYPHVRALNAKGPTLPARPPLPFIPDQGLAKQDAVMVDARPPHLFGAGHRRGALSVVGNESFAVRVGSVVPFGSPLVLLTDDADQASRLRDQLAVIGYDDVRGYASPLGSERAGLQRIEQLDPQAVAARGGDGEIVLDVREPAEWEQGHVPGALHIPFGELARRMGELPVGRRVITYCASGIRSSLAASMLEQAGRESANMRGGFTAWRGAGLPVEH